MISRLLIPLSFYLYIGYRREGILASGAHRCGPRVLLLPDHHDPVHRDVVPSLRDSLPHPLLHRPELLQPQGGHLDRRGPDREERGGDRQADAEVTRDRRGVRQRVRVEQPAGPQEDDPHAGEAAAQEEGYRDAGRRIQEEVLRAQQRNGGRRGRGRKSRAT